MNVLDIEMATGIERLLAGRTYVLRVSPEARASDVQRIRRRIDDELSRLPAAQRPAIFVAAADLPLEDVTELLTGGPSQ